MTDLLTIDHPSRTAPGTAATVKGWHRDPWGRHDLRYHDGDGWSDHVTHFGPVPCTGCAGGR